MRFQVRIWYHGMYPDAGSRIFQVLEWAREPHFAIRALMHEAALKANEDPDRLSFLHAVRVVRRKLPQFAAIPPAEKTIS